MKKYPYQNTGLQNLKGERWKDIPGLEMYFKVSNFGRVKRLEYEMEYSDGRVYIKPAKIIKPVLMNVPNEFMKDHVHFLRVAVTLSKQRYNFSLARLVYHCFIKPIPPEEDLVVLAKDRDNRNIRPSNLIRATISDKQRRIFLLNRTVPLVVSEESRKKANAKLRLLNNKQVTQYSMQGKKIKTFPSVARAAKKTGVSPSHISNRAGGTEFSAGGFIWRFGSAPEIDIQPMLDTIEKRRKKNKDAFGKKITQYQLDGRRVASFPTIADAAKATGISHNGISQVIRKRRASAGKFYWLEGKGPAVIDLSRHEYGEVLRAKNRQRPVRQYSRSGKPLRSFASIKEAADSVGVKDTTLIGALRGKHETAGGFKWEYL